MPGLFFVLKQGLAKLWRASLSRERERERQRDRETGRERAKELRLAVNPDPPVSASQSTGITTPGLIGCISKYKR